MSDKNRTIQVNDLLMSKDEILEHVSGNVGKVFRTQLIAGTGDYSKDHNGMTILGEKLVEEENITVLGGVITMVEKLTGIKSKLKVEYLDNILRGVVGSGEKPLASDTVKDEVLCLFGVGTGGAGEASTDVIPAKFFNREIPQMIPIRQTAVALQPSEREKYWFKKTTTVSSETKTQYFLKSFDAPVEIKTLWLDNPVEGEDGSPVSDNVHTTLSTNTTGITCFIEMLFSLNPKDCQEVFADRGGVEVPKINSIGVFTGVKHNIRETEYDYRRVKLFSLINIYNESLANKKDVKFIYRIYLF